MMPRCAQGFRNGPAVDAGHGDIEKKQVGLAVLCKVEARFAVVSAEDDEPQWRQNFAEQVALCRIVIGDENCPARTVIAEDRRVNGFDACRVRDLDSSIFT